MTHLPPHRQAASGRTHSRLWDSAEYGAALTRHRRRTTLLDRLCWLASAALVLGAAWIVWG